MPETYNVYCDESCYLEHDRQPIMALGAVWCPMDHARLIAERLREVKAKHGLPRHLEVKWTKVSPGKVAFYLDLVHAFFAERDLRFRAVVVPDKSQLRHEDFEQDHDTFYYKMYFELLRKILDPRSRYRIYLDIKDTRSSVKMEHLRRALSFNMRDFEQEVVERIQPVRSHEVEQVQLADLLLGAVSYANRNLATGAGKVALVQALREHTGYTLTSSTPLSEEKFNVFVWQAREPGA